MVFLCVCVFFWCSLGSMKMHVWFSISESQLPLLMGPKTNVGVFFFSWRERKESTEPAYAFYGYKALDKIPTPYIFGLFFPVFGSSGGNNPTPLKSWGSDSTSTSPMSFDLHEVSSSGTFAFTSCACLAAGGFPRFVCGLVNR